MWLCLKKGGSLPYANYWVTQNTFWPCQHKIRIDTFWDMAILILKETHSVEISGFFCRILSLRFYVKSILVDVKVLKSNCRFCHSWGSEFCYFSYFSQYQLLKSVKIHKNQNSEFTNVLKWQILHFQNLQQWFHIKSEW